MKTIVETFAGESAVIMSVNTVTGMWTVKQYGYSGNLENKMSCDTKYAADAYYQQYKENLK